MASTIVTKNSSTASAVPLTGDLTQGELAVNVTDKKLYTKDSGGTVVKLVGGLGNQEANAVAITGGSVNGTTIGATTASTGAFTTLSASGTTTLSGGTANGVAYLNGSKVVTTGSALTFDGTNLGVGTASPNQLLDVRGANGVGMRFLETTTGNTNRIQLGTGSGYGYIDATAGAGSTALAFQVASSEQMRLTSTGLGIGTSSPGSKLTVLSTGSTIEAKQSSAGAATYYVMDTTVETNGKRWRFGYTGASGTTPGMFSFLNVTDNVIGPVIDSSGNLGLGVTPSAWNASHPAFQFKYNTAISSYSSNDGLELTSNGYADTATTWKYIESYSAAQYVVGGGQHAWKNAALGTAGAAITWTQAMTLDAGGNLLVGTTSSSGRITVYPASNSQYGAWIASQSSGDVGNAMLVLAKYDNNTTTSQIFAQFRVNSSTLSGYITANGANAATFTSSSDIRLKENIEQLPNQLDNICSLNPVEFDFKDGSGHQIGFIAQEMQNVYSDAVAEGPDGYLMISGWSKTEARLVKAIQEQQALITQLTERITALEGK